MSGQLTGVSGRRAVALGIRRALMAGDMVPGQRLIEQELAEDFGATRSSVREALQDLAAEDLVELVPRRGARVRVVSVEEAIQITECRVSLEALCAYRAAEVATEEQRAALRVIGEQMKDAVAEGALNTYSALNRQLHELIIKVSGQKVAGRLLERLNGQMVRYQFRLAMRPGRPSKSLPQHLAMIDAVAGADPIAAESAVRVHLASVIDELRLTPSRSESLLRDEQLQET
ncbi:GntR family transcriptional regulator [Arthrobacter sp. MDT2-16]